MSFRQIVRNVKLFYLSNSFVMYIGSVRFYSKLIFSSNISFDNFYFYLALQVIQTFSFGSVVAEKYSAKKASKRHLYIL
jgi:hypothetical protein